MHAKSGRYRNGEMRNNTSGVQDAISYPEAATHVLWPVPEMPRLNPLLLLPIGAFWLIFIISIVTFNVYVPNEGNVNTEDVFDLFIFSSYYFPQSKSMGDNTVAIVFTADFEMGFAYNHLEFQVSSETDSSIVRAPIQRITPHHKCKWIDYTVQFTAVSNTDRVRLNIGDKLIEIPTTTPPREYHDVVTCIAPLYASEQWQLAVFAAHVYKRFGSHMYLYARSMVSPMFDLLKEYEKEGYLTIQPWLRIQLESVSPDDFIPNLNVEFRNQGAAQTDCLLRHKETTSFISFVDLDDILIPRLHNSYYDEFEDLFNSMTNLAYIVYFKENVRSITRKSGNHYSLTELVSSVKYEHKKETGKQVTRPELVNSSWIHWSPKIPDGMTGYQVPSRLNSITHFKHVSVLPGASSSKFKNPLYNPEKDGNVIKSELIDEEDLIAMENDFQRITSSENVTNIVPQLPTEFYYGKLIAQCYERGFYKYFYDGQLVQIKCFGPERCIFPESPGILCHNAVADYESHEGNVFNVHFGKSGRFEKQDGCIR